MSTPADKQILEPGLQIACRRRDAEDRIVIVMAGRVPATHHRHGLLSGSALNPAHPRNSTQRILAPQVPAEI